jgi:hypothetical protein
MKLGMGKLRIKVKDPVFRSKKRVGIDESSGLLIACFRSWQTHSRWSNYKKINQEWRSLHVIW